MDIIKLLGGEPANFLDIGGGASSEKVTAAFRIILADAKVKAILINVFGGITRCDEVAKGILSAMKQVKPKVPVIVRLVGTNKDEGMKMLEGSNIITADSLIAAAKLAIKNAQGVAK
jgi:succinyl-CoA synthetase beta subunit